MEVVDLTATTSPAPLDQAKLDMTSAIALWKTNPKLYIQQEREKTLIRRANENALAAFESSEPSVALKVFTSVTKFGKLPYELRLMIWQLVMKELRIVEIVLDKWTAKEARGCRLKSLPSAPPILHVDHESREIGKKVYKHISVVSLIRCGLQREIGA